jgi:HAD superfamily hydrolase (TIGR01490 family)
VKDSFNTLSFPHLTFCGRIGPVTSIIAFFDMDRTILSDSSGLLYMRYLRRRGEVGWPAVLRAYGYAFLYKVGLFDYPAVAAKLASSVSTNSEAEMQAFCQRWFDDMVIKYVVPRAVERIDEHRRQGHLVTIISAATPYVVGPVARHLSIDEYLSTLLEVVDGRLTGKFVEPACYGAGKVYWAQEFADRHAACLSEAYFYSDSHTDLPLLDQVGHPVAVNPDPRLRSTAARRNWPVEQFY